MRTNRTLKALMLICYLASSGYHYIHHLDHLDRGTSYLSRSVPESMLQVDSADFAAPCEHHGDDHHSDKKCMTCGASSHFYLFSMPFEISLKHTEGIAASSPYHFFIPQPQVTLIKPPPRFI